MPALPLHSLPSPPCSVQSTQKIIATHIIVSVSVAVPGCICICCSGCIWIWVVVVVRRRCLVDWLVTIQLMRLRAREFWIRIQARLLFQCWLANYRNFCMKLDYFKIVTNKLIAHYAQTATWHSPLFALYFFAVASVVVVALSLGISEVKSARDGTEFQTRITRVWNLSAYKWNGKFIQSQIQIQKLISLKNHLSASARGFFSVRSVSTFLGR